MPGSGRTIIGAAAVAALIALAAPGSVAAQSGTRPEAPRGSPLRMFQQADSDGDGRLTEAEGGAWPSDRIVLVDVNRDGGLSLEEWRAVWPPDGKPTAQVRAEQQRAEAFFRGVDADRDGRVAPAELRPFTEALSRSFDRDGDGVLTAAEVPGSPAASARPRGSVRGRGADPDLGPPKN